MKLWRFLVLGLTGFVLHSCSSADESGNFQLSAIKYDFGESLNGWVPGFSDYPAGTDDSTFYELQFQYTESPVNNRKSIMLSGNNHSDDLFMFLKKKLDNLRPNTMYTLTFEVEFASNAKAGEVGAGGAPGESVFMKVGASALEPKSLIDNNHFVLNIDKGNQALGGNDMIIIGDISVPADATGYVLTSRSNSPDGSNIYNTPVVVRSNNKGELWLIVGTDSGYEGITTLYYSKITAVISRSM
jgi:hypothetical protein